MCKFQPTWYRWISLLAQIISPTLLSFVPESKMGSCVIPLGRTRKLGYDQSTTQITGEMGCSDSVMAKFHMIDQRGEHVVAKFHTTY